ncbi:MAG: polyphosphate:AMP phosphotransferase [Nannocystaceae bacterium]
MFESAEIDHEVPKSEYTRAVEEVRHALLDAQQRLLDDSKQAVLVVIAGLDGGGKGETVQEINSWLDPRHVRTVAFGAPSDEERERPPLWRYWRMLPPKGKVGIFFDSWYEPPLHGRAYGNWGQAQFDRAVERASRFERMLANEGFVLLKLWFHLSKAQQRKRLRELEKDKLTRWRVTDEDWRRFEHYDALVDTAKRALRLSSTEFAPWIVVPGRDERYRSLVVARGLLDAMVNDDLGAAPAETALHPVPAIDGQNVLRALDQGEPMAKDEYKIELERWQGTLARLVRRPSFRKRSLVIVFEGMDAAGKGGAIRRFAAALDPRLYTLVPIAAPTDEERARPYLWRFWRHLPRKGNAVVFDRSWYGRVLVERVEGFCTTSDWMRAYSEINDFEEQMHEHGAVIVKLWLQIDPEEQLRRFRERETEVTKRYKIGPEDWRNREKWPAYENAVADMVDRTSTELAPWTLIPANDKNRARVTVLRTICERLEAALDDD